MSSPTFFTRTNSNMDNSFEVFGRSESNLGDLRASPELKSPNLERQRPRTPGSTTYDKYPNDDTVIVPSKERPTIKLTNAQTPSIYIPFCFANISKERILGAFERLGWGEIDRIDEIAMKPVPGKKQIKKVFVHFKQWEPSSSPQHWRQKYLNGEEIKIVYDGEWYWKTKASTAPKPDFNNQKN